MRETIGYVGLLVFGFMGCGPSHPLDGAPITCQVEHGGEDALGFYTCDPDAEDGRDFAFSPRSADATWIAGCFPAGSVAHRDEDGRIIVIGPSGTDVLETCWNASVRQPGWVCPSLVRISQCGGSPLSGASTLTCPTPDGGEHPPTCLYLGPTRHVLEP